METAAQSTATLAVYPTVQPDLLVSHSVYISQSGQQYIRVSIEGRFSRYSVYNLSDRCFIDRGDCPKPLQAAIASALAQLATDGKLQWFWYSHKGIVWAGPAQRAALNNALIVHVPANASPWTS
ncbi:hypothetical protein [Herpetosiphon gulosus]|uniref:Uncharacterized protein n=1 Tax=Herpetosiphon gulosus TaxID=1973496 RepID=A0ABP9X7W7_9CHLR